MLLAMEREKRERDTNQYFHILQRIREFFMIETKSSESAESFKVFHIPKTKIISFISQQFHMFKPGGKGKGAGEGREGDKELTTKENTSYYHDRP